MRGKNTLERRHQAHGMSHMMETGQQMSGLGFAIIWISLTMRRIVGLGYIL
jgi:hypothetical protein